ncbi:hypothetical protein Aph02nite_37350 [Actinoplanes philippinensis]|uniref:Uncharacterized protein n=1 Tax=Actinoplanes philippinensis TaxID=35752 RepID=A0A1I2FKA8_9ACTN|nr:hypothetical protein [Actinoplanes philippinensis]GIE77785.1 hypothetical protein Aph02nite_37350 [Actinoplanes philippinensis]SFF04891.1 hypothetical protein SAMN05421541_105421 [Actinoplanes philippinensis]
MSARRTLFAFALDQSPPGESRAIEYRGFRCVTRSPKDLRRHGAAAAARLDAYFARPAARPDELLDAFHDVDVPIHHNVHLAAAASHADPNRVREAGRWLIRNSVHECSATLGLALLAEDTDPADLPDIETMGRLGDRFAPLAARAIRRRTPDMTPLIRLAGDAHGWARAYYVEALCEVATLAPVRAFLLRHASDGDYLNGYFARRVAIVASLHEAITVPDPDEELVDHTGRLLTVMTFGSGMGSDLGSYPAAGPVLTAYAGHLGRMAPTLERYRRAACLGEHLTTRAPEQIGRTPEQHARLIRRFRSILGRRSWQAAAQEQAAPEEAHHLRHAARVLTLLQTENGPP